jgi:2-phospho-L-lactate guanylyltransferase (CobY/MobA/RfbA family)
LLLLGELRGDVKAILANQERLNDRIYKAEQKLEEHKLQSDLKLAETTDLIHKVKARQSHMVGWATGAGAVLGTLLMLLKDKIQAFLA